MSKPLTELRDKLRELISDFRERRAKELAYGINPGYKFTEVQSLLDYIDELEGKYEELRWMMDGLEK